MLSGFELYARWVPLMSVNKQQQLYLYPAVPYIDLHDTKKLDKYIERVQAAHNNH